MKVKIQQKGYDLEAEKVFEKEVKVFSKSSAHIILPKKYIGEKVLIVIMATTGQWLKGYKKKYAKEKKVAFPGGK